MEQKKEYKFPVGDFLSGFSDDNKKPCDYELECQRIVIRGVQYLDENPNLYELIINTQVNWSDLTVRPMIDYMCFNEEDPESEFSPSMVVHTIRESIHAKIIGWNEYIKKLKPTTTRWSTTEQFKPCKLVIQ